MLSSRLILSALLLMGVSEVPSSNTSVTRRAGVAPCDSLPAPFLMAPVIVRLAVEERDRGNRPYSESELVALRGIAERLQRLLPMPEGNPRAKRDGLFMVLDSTRKFFTPDLVTGFSLSLRDDGSITDVESARSRGREAADSLLAEGARLAGKSPSLAGFASVFGGKSVRLQVSTAARIDLRPDEASKRVEVPWYDVTVPVYRGTSVEVIAGSVGPRFPEELMRKGEGGEVLTRFVVQPDGKVDQRSISIVRSSQAEFAIAVRRWLSKAKYVPGTVEGCTISTFVAQPFMFGFRMLGG